MVVARSVKEVFDYVLQDDRLLPVEKQTVFHLRRFSTRLSLRVQDLQSSRGQIAEVVLRAGIAGWTNFADADGEHVGCKHESGLKHIHGCEVRDPLTLECLDRLSPEIAGEIASAIIMGNTLTTDDVKN